jgi:hypothetical protein
LKLNAANTSPTTQGDAPEAIIKAIHRAQRRGETSGKVVGAGHFWQWRSVFHEDTILEFTRDGIAVDHISIPTTGWRAFCLVASRRNVDPRSWLVTILGDGLSRGVSIKEMVAWLFPRKSPEIQRFETARCEFHRGEISAGWAVSA